MIRAVVPDSNRQPLTDMEKDALLMVLCRYYDLGSCKPSMKRGNTEIKAAWTWMLHNKESYMAELAEQARITHEQLFPTPPPAVPAPTQAQAPDPRAAQAAYDAMVDVSPPEATAK